MKYLFGKNQIIVNLAGSQFQTKQTRSQVNYTNVNNIEKLILSNEASVKMSRIKSLIAFFVNRMLIFCIWDVMLYIAIIQPSIQNIVWHRISIIQMISSQILIPYSSYNMDYPQEVFSIVIRFSNRCVMSN